MPERGVSSWLRQGIRAPQARLVIERAAMPAFGTALIIERIALGICLEARRVRCAATHSTTLADNPEFTIRARFVP